MPSFTEKLNAAKFKTQDQFEHFLLENSTKSVLKELEENGITPDSLSAEEMNELIAEELNQQREYAKGLATGSISLAVLLELLG
jgi:hypothetical protein